MAIRYTQPQGYCGIDAKYAQGLQALVNPALGKRNLVTGGSYSSPSGLSVSRSGVVQINQAFASTLAQSVSVSAGSDFTAVIHVAGINQNTNNSGLFRSATGSDTFCLVKTGASGYRPWIRVNATDVYNASSGPQVPTGRPVTIVFSWRSGKGYEIAWDGAVQHSGASAVATPAFTFNVFGSQNGELIGDFALFAFFTKAENAASLSANPWQIFKSSQSITTLLTSASGPAQYTLTAQGGSYTKTGASATLLKSKLLTAQGSSYTKSGASATLKYNRLISAQGGSYLKSGADAVLLRHKNLSVQGGSYTKTGANATITYTGLANSYTLTCQGGVYTQTGSTATILKSKLLVAAGGTYTFTGRPVVITYSGAPPTSGLLPYLNVLNGEFCLFKPLN